MSKKTDKKTTKPRSPKPPAAQVDTANLVREDLDEQQEPLPKTAAAGAAALRTPAPATPAGQPPAPAKVPLKPLTPLAALWPDVVPSNAESGSSQAASTTKGSSCVHRAKASARRESAVTAASCPIASGETPGESGCGRTHHEADSTQRPSASALLSINRTPKGCHCAANLMIGRPVQRP